MSMPQLVTVGEWRVSTITGHGIDGANLNVYRIVPCERTPDHPYPQRFVYAAKDMPFPTTEAARRWAWQNGYLQPYCPQRAARALEALA